MSDILIREIKSFENLVQTLLQTVKSTNDHAERLRSVEQLLERVVAATEATQHSVERNEQMMQQAWRAYAEMNQKQSK